MQNKAGGDNVLIKFTNRSCKSRVIKFGSLAIAIEKLFKKYRGGLLVQNKNGMFEFMTEYSYID